MHGPIPQSGPLMQATGTREMTKRVLLGQFMHETNTFCRRLTDESAFRGFYCHEGDAVLDALAGTQNEVAGFADVARAEGWELVTPVATFATPGGPVTHRAWEAFGERILTTARRDGHFDAVLLSLHGAMVLEDGRDGDARLVRELRAVVGARVPLVVTLDLHANLDPGMADEADIILSYKTFPHVDMRDTGRRAAEALRVVLADAPTQAGTVVRKPAMISLPEGGRTDRQPMQGLMARAQELTDATRGILDVSLNAGFTFSDVPEIGPSVSVVHLGAPDIAEQIADELCEAMWAARDADQEEVLTPQQAAAIAAAHPAGPGIRPLVLADISDNPGDGAYADSTALLAALLHDGGSDILFGAMHDPEAVAVARAAGHDNEVALCLGGKADPDFGGGPLQVQAHVEHLGDGHFVGGGPMWKGVAQSAGPSALLRIGGVRVLVTSHATQALDLEIFRSNGIDPLAMRVVALKSTQHFRAAYAPVSTRICLVDGGGLASPRLERLRYRRIPRPIHPLDK